MSHVNCGECGKEEAIPGFKLPLWYCVECRKIISPEEKERFDAMVSRAVGALERLFKEKDKAILERILK